jgi:hypothetical protein
VSFAAITLCVGSQRVFIIVVIYFVIDSVRKLLDTPSYLIAMSYFVISRQFFKLYITHTYILCFLGRDDGQELA